VRFGIFVQNGYYTDPVLPEQPPALFDLVYQAADLVLSISEDSGQMVALNYPRLDPDRILRVQYSVHERFLAPNDAGAKSSSCITFMPRKMGAHAVRVVFALRQHLPPRWEIRAIHNVNEATVAAMLTASRIFLSFSEFEGLPLPPLEAALAGNLVIGYTGQGAKEYWHAPNFQEVHQGDVRGFVTAACQASREVDAMRLTRADLAPGIEHLARRFSPVAEAENLCVLIGRIADCFTRHPAGTAFASRLR
jgi:glycosyltransferase involved in cell wall biosynthesis